MKLIEGPECSRTCLTLIEQAFNTPEYVKSEEPGRQAGIQLEREEKNKMLKGRKN